MPFATDEQLARRVRAVASELQRRDPCQGAGVLGAFALELEAVALILDPEETASTPSIVGQQLRLG